MTTPEPAPEPVTAPAPAAPAPAKPGLLERFAPYRKFFTSIVGLGLTYASLYWGNNPQDGKWISLAVAAASAVGVYAVPNAPKP